MKLSPEDYNSAASLLNCEPAAIKAVSRVETARSGFLSDGRPNILFESHSFHTLTKGVYDESYPNLSTPAWVRNYGAAGSYQWDRMQLAMTLNRSAALQSASWGAFQIMGSNFAACGFRSVEDFASAMKVNESAHLMAFCRFVSSSHAMLTALQNKDWATFARLYNGPGYAQNQYDTKMADAYLEEIGGEDGNV